MIAEFIIRTDALVAEFIIRTTALTASVTDFVVNFASALLAENGNTLVSETGDRLILES